MGVMVARATYGVCVGSRVAPQVGMEVTVRHLDAEVGGEIVAIHDGGRRLVVETVEGRELEFTLRGATGVFHAPGHGPRLLLRPPQQEHGG
jgi:predicted thioesterase